MTIIILANIPVLTMVLIACAKWHTLSRYCAVNYFTLVRIMACHNGFSGTVCFDVFYEKHLIVLHILLNVSNLLYVHFLFYILDVFDNTRHSYIDGFVREETFSKV